MMDTPKQAAMARDAKVARDRATTALLRGLPARIRASAVPARRRWRRQRGRPAQDRRAGRRKRVRLPDLRFPITSLNSVPGSEYAGKYVERLEYRAANTERDRAELR